MIELDTAWLVRQWALWSHEHDGGTAGCALASIVPTDNRGRLYRERSVIADDVALRVELVMAELRQRDRDGYAVLKAANRFHDWGWRRVADYCGVSRYLAGKIYEAAYEFVDERLKIELSVAA